MQVVRTTRRKWFLTILAAFGVVKLVPSPRIPDSFFQSTRFSTLDELYGLASRGDCPDFIICNRKTYEWMKTQKEWGTYPQSGNYIKGPEGWFKRPYEKMQNFPASRLPA